jgi:hypothetical protein
MPGFDNMGKLALLDQSVAEIESHLDRLVGQVRAGLQDLSYEVAVADFFGFLCRLHLPPDTVASLAAVAIVKLARPGPAESRTVSRQPA